MALLKGTNTMARKQTYDYFDLFLKLVDYSCAAARIVDDVLNHFDPEQLPARLEEIHKIEHTADIEKHEMMTALAREFLPPIEPEDITELAQSIDDVTDALEDVLVKIYTFNILSIREEALAFSGIIMQCCDALRTAVREFRNFKKNSSLTESIIEINRLEGEGDALYTKAMRDLHVNSKDPIEIMVWSKTFNYLEGCCDACEDVSDVMEGVVMKNS